MSVTEIHHSRVAPPPFIPDDLTIPQFLLDDYQHPLKPTHIPGVPWLIEEQSGRKIGIEEVSETRTLTDGNATYSRHDVQIRKKTSGLANAIKSRWNIGTSSSPSSIWGCV